MKRLTFGSDGQLLGVDGEFVDHKSEEQIVSAKVRERYAKGGFGKSSYIGETRDYKKKYSKKVNNNLKKTEDLSFLKDDSDSKKDGGVGDIFEKNYWNLNEDGERIKPLKFSNGKTQEDVVKEIVDLINGGVKVIFLHGVCGSGKSAIGLNVIRVLGKGSVVVPVKTLQKQYEEDYAEKKYLIKSDGTKMKIAMLTGRDNHDSIINPGFSCADPGLPENIKITEKNYQKLLEYYKDNPYINDNSELPELNDIRRLSVAPSNPYWSPILPASFEIRSLGDAKKKHYIGADGQKYIFYHRKKGCSYYDQYLAYTCADAIVFNSSKYLIELAIGRKPATDVEIIDEADEFLDSLFKQEELNLSRLASSLKMLNCDSDSAKSSIAKILDLIGLESKNKFALGIDENKVFHINETKLVSLFKVFLSDSELQSEIAIDELNYSNKALEIAKIFEDSFKDCYLTYKKDENNLFVKLASTNLSGKFKEILNKSKALVFMSGTLHSENVLKHIFGIEDFNVVDAETTNLGSIEILRTGKEFDCKYSNFSSETFTRKDYLESLNLCLHRAVSPSLVHVVAFNDLPNEIEKRSLNLSSLHSVEKVRDLQSFDNSDKTIALFKQGLADRLFTTKCSRGMDFPGDMCKSVIFTKYPNPNINDIFWKILKKTHPNYFWEFYKDKARREFLQRIYRAIRFADDHVYVLSPDIRVLDAVRKFQETLDKSL